MCFLCKDLMVSVFVEIGDDTSATLLFTFGVNVPGSREFEIKITQYRCNSEMRPPEGCLQYFTGTDGRITTFNWAGDGVHLPDQQYSICIRRELGKFRNALKKIDFPDLQGVPSQNVFFKRAKNIRKPICR